MKQRRQGGALEQFVAAAQWFGGQDLQGLLQSCMSIQNVSFYLPE